MSVIMFIYMLCMYVCPSIYVSFRSLYIVISFIREEDRSGYARVRLCWWFAVSVPRLARTRPAWATLCSPFAFCSFTIVASQNEHLHWNEWTLILNYQTIERNSKTCPGTFCCWFCLRVFVCLTDEIHIIIPVNINLPHSVHNRTFWAFVCK